MVQLDKLATYHRALSDITRLRIVFLLKDGELHGQALSEQLQVSPPTITHHMAKLREASLVDMRRDKNTIYFSLVEHSFVQYAKESLKLMTRFEQEEKTTEEAEQQVRFKNSVLATFFTSEGKLRSIPAKYKKKLIILEKMMASFELGKTYSEQEINEKIRYYHEDVATIRREFIMQRFMSREKEQYEVNPKSLWVKWETLT